MELSQREADLLLMINKHCREIVSFLFPPPGGKISIALYSDDDKEKFNLDITRGRIKLSKISYNTLARKASVLARIDIDGSRHRNPDGECIDGTHLHLYREGYGDKWAVPLPKELFAGGNIYELLDDFMDYCHVVTKPNIERGLFG